MTFTPGNDNGAPNLGNGDTGPTEPRGPWDAYEFGAPESVLDRSQIFDLFEVVRGPNGMNRPFAAWGWAKPIAWPRIINRPSC
jgi:hypothetical protein